MPQHKSAIKRMKQNQKRRARNSYYISTLKTYEKKFLKEIDDKKDYDELKKLYNKIVSLYDKVADKGIIHRNKAARKVSVFTKRINGIKPADSQ